MRRPTCLAVLLFLPFVAEVSRPAGPGPCAGLLGQPFAAVLARLGPPEQGRGSAGCVRWQWPDAGGGQLQLVVHADHVVQVDERHCRGAPVAKPLPAEGFYPGQPVEELLARLGNPQLAGEAWQAPFGAVARPLEPVAKEPLADLRLGFGELRLLVSAGRVLGVEPPPPPGHGPR